jgi:butyryl-CoA dehydrogenase
MERVEMAARKVVAAVAEGDMLRTQMMIVRRLFKHDPFNTITLQQQIAQKLLETGKYVTA